MRRDLHTLTESGMCVQEIGTIDNLLQSYGAILIETAAPENIMATTDVKCFPIVASATSRTLSGYIGRTELRYVLGTSLLP